MTTPMERISEEGFLPDLGDLPVSPPVSLADKWGLPPVSVLDRRTERWMRRREEWLSLGLQGELGRAEGIGHNFRPGDHPVRSKVYEYQQGRSVFDPVLCEIVYRWYSAPGWDVLDVFAGGPPRGVVAGRLGRKYTGIDLYKTQVDANEAQGEALVPEPFQPPIWITGDSWSMVPNLGDRGYEADLLFTCPPYYDLEKYGDAVTDLSNMDPEEFDQVHEEIIAKAAALLRPDRFAVWVVGDVRDQRTGLYRCLPEKTVRAFEAAGLRKYNEIVLVDQVATKAMTAERSMRVTRKVAKVHQNVLVFVKGDPRKATEAMGEVIE